MSGIRFRPATPDDAGDLSALVNSAYRGESSKAGWTTEADILGGQRTDPDSLRAMMADPDQVFLLAFDDTGMIGSVNVERNRTAAWPEGRVFFGMLTVKPDLQSRGLGRRLIERAESFARDEWGARSLFLTVISIRSELIAYYERRGYRATGERKDFPMNDPKFGLPKRQDFHLAVYEKAL